MSDFNGKIGKDGWLNWPNNVRKFNTGIINKNCEKLLQLCSINDLGIMNVMYERPAKRHYT